MVRWLLTGHQNWIPIGAKTIKSSVLEILHMLKVNNTDSTNISTNKYQLQQLQLQNFKLMPVLDNVHVFRITKGFSWDWEQCLLLILLKMCICAHAVGNQNIARKKDLMKP